MLELLPVRPDLGVDERTHRVPHHLQLFGPLEHHAAPDQANRHRIREPAAAPEASDSRHALPRRRSHPCAHLTDASSAVIAVIGIAAAFLASCSGQQSEKSSSNSAAIPDRGASRVGAPPAAGPATQLVARREPRGRQATRRRPPGDLDRAAPARGARHRPDRSTGDGARARRAGLRVLRVGKPRRQPARQRRVQGCARALRRRREGSRPAGQARAPADRDGGRDRPGRRSRRPAHRRADKCSATATTVGRQRQRRRPPQRRTTTHHPRRRGRLALGPARCAPRAGRPGHGHPRRERAPRPSAARARTTPAPASPADCTPAGPHSPAPRV